MKLRLIVFGYFALFIIIALLILKESLTENAYNAMVKLDSLQLEYQKKQYELIDHIQCIEIKALELKLAICKGDTVLSDSDSLILDPIKTDTGVWRAFK